MLTCPTSLFIHSWHDGKLDLIILTLTKSSSGLMQFSTGIESMMGFTLSLSHPIMEKHVAFILLLSTFQSELIESEADSCDQAHPCLSCYT
jgi:hypothetical protein